MLRVYVSVYYCCELYESAVVALSMAKVETHAWVTIVYRPFTSARGLSLEGARYALYDWRGIPNRIY